MSAHPLPSTHPMTVDEYLAMGEDQDDRSELVKGYLEMSASPMRRHSQAVVQLTHQLLGQLPRHLEVNNDLDVDMQLADPQEPGTVRRPDVLVNEVAAGERADYQGRCLQPSEVVLAVEIVSPSSRLIDHKVKRSEYADAGIPWYWIVDIDDPVSVLVYRLTDEFGYCEEQTATGTLVTERPFPMEIDLTKLR